VLYVFLEINKSMVSALWEQGAAGSNPATPTRSFREAKWPFIVFVEVLNVFVCGEKYDKRPSRRRTFLSWVSPHFQDHEI